MWITHNKRVRNKIKNNKYHIVGTTPNSNGKIVEWGNIKTSNTQMYNLLVICLATGTSTKSVGVKLVWWAKHLPS